MDNMISTNPKSGELYKIIEYKDIKNQIRPKIIGYPTQNLHNDIDIKQVHLISSNSIIMFLSTEKSKGTDKYMKGKYRWSWKILHNNNVIFIPKTIRIKFNKVNG